jgi:hypothetical protein
MTCAEGVDQPMAMRQRRGRVTEKDGTMLIKDVFEHFLSEQQSQLAPKTYRDSASVMELFEHQ